MMYDGEWWSQSDLWWQCFGTVFIFATLLVVAVMAGEDKDLPYE